MNKGDTIEEESIFLRALESVRDAVGVSNS